MLRSVSILNEENKIKADGNGQTTSANKIELKKILTEYVGGENQFQYDYFLNFVKQKQTNAPFLIDMLQQLRPCVHMLDPKLFESSLINLIFFDIKWVILHSKEEQLLGVLAEFLIDLNSAYASYIYKCLNMLIKNFLIINSSDETSIDCEAVYAFTHHIIRNLIKIAPSYKTYLVKQIDSFYPYMTKDTLIQEAYILNVMKITDYIKDIRLSLLETCIQKMLKVDVNCTREQISEAEINSQILLDSPENQLISMHLPLADRLDTMMQKLFLFINKNSHTNSLNKVSENQEEVDAFDWEACKSIYKDLLFTFDKYIMCTYGSSHVQFLMFYVCSFKSMLSEGFLDYLWKKFNSPASCQITKQICTYYIGSFLARAKYIHINTCVATLQLIVTWIHKYIGKFSNTNNNANFDLHRTFYAICQTLFYVIIFRHQQLFDQNNDNSDLVKSWKLNEIVSSKLNPLRYCLASVQKKFSRVAYVNQIAYCYAIIDSNNRVSLPTTNDSAVNKRSFFSNKNNKNNFVENPLDSFFPFDPYLLKRSKPFIEKFYQEFQSLVDDEMELESDIEDEDLDSDTDNDENNNSDDEHKTQLDEDSDIENSIEDGNDRRF